MRQEFEVRLSVEAIQNLLKGKRVLFQQYGARITIHPPQEGRFITYKEVDDIIRDRTNIVDRLLRMMEDKE